MAPLMGYWNVRGYAGHLRLLMANAGLDWEEKSYERGNAPDFAHDPAWTKDKEDGLGLDFPNLPYYIDGDVKLSQSMAIARYLGRKYGMIATTEDENRRQDLAEYQLLDLRTALGKLGYQEYSDEAKATHIKDTLPFHLKALSKFLGGNDWLAGSKPNFVDFLMYDIFDWHLYLAPDCLSGYPNLAAFMKRVEELPKIKAFLSSDKFHAWPIFNKVAKWGYKHEDQYARFPHLAK